MKTATPNGTAPADKPLSAPDRGTNPFHALPGEPAPILLAAAFESAGLSEAVTARFRAKGLFSAQDVEDWLAKPCDDEPGEPSRTNHLTDIPGIGPLMATRITQALFAAKASREPENKARAPLAEHAPEALAALLEKMRLLDEQWAAQEGKIATLKRHLKTEQETLNAVIAQHREVGRALTVPPVPPEKSLFDHIEGNGEKKP
jgi:hypothetical protein